MKNSPTNTNLKALNIDDLLSIYGGTDTSSTDPIIDDLTGTTAAVVEDIYF
jgi:hypothetical protein